MKTIKFFIITLLTFIFFSCQIDSELNLNSIKIIKITRTLYIKSLYLNLLPKRKTKTIDFLK